MTAATIEAPFVVTEPGVYELDDDTYHGDPVPEGSLSCSGAKLLLPPSCPARFKWARDHEEKSTKEFDMGKAAHKLVLGTGPTITEVKHDSWRTNAAKEAAAFAREGGEVPLLTKDYKTVHAMADAIRSHPMASRLFNPDHGQPEMSLFWIDEATGVWRRSKLDWLPERNGRRMIVPDYKTAVSANPADFGKTAMRLGYHMQSPQYRDAVLALKLAIDARFVFVVQEKEPPFLVSVIELDPTAVAIGQLLNRRALRIYAKCVAEDSWPGYSDNEVAQAFLPTYYERGFEDELR